MGIFADLASTAQYPGKPLGVGLDRSSTQQILAAADYSDPVIAALYAAADEVATIPHQTDSGAADTYTLTLTFHGSLAANDAVTTAAIAYNAVDSTIEAAIDTAMTAASFPSWTNADISVLEDGAAGVSDDAVVVTFDGASVTEAPVVITLTATGFTATTPIVRTTAGQADRKAMQALIQLNVITGTLHDVGETPTYTKPAALGRRPRTQCIRDLALLVTAAEGNEDVYDAVVALYPQVAQA
jgi:hypothetical protein